MKKRDLIDKRHRLIEEARGLIDGALKDKRALTAEDQSKYESLMAEQDNLRKTIEAAERQEKLDQEMAERQGDPAPKGDGAPAARATALSPEIRRLIDEAPEARRKDLELRASPEYNAKFRHWLATGEARDMQVGSDEQGGFLVTPLQFVTGIIKALDDSTFIRRRATKHTVVNAQSLGALTMDADVEDADWTVELDVGGEENELAFGRREFRPNPLAKLAKISNKLLRSSAIAADSFLLSRLAYKFGLTEEKHFLVGDGDKKPLGVFTAHADGIPASRDVQTGSATGLTMDGLISAKYALKSPYWADAAWAFHRTAVEKIALLKNTTTNEYLWQPSVQLGQPDRLLAIPIEVSEHIPNTFTSGLYVGMLAAWSNYWIADALSMTVQRLVELFAAKNQTGFIGRLETDGQPALAEAFVRLKTN